MLTGEIRNQVDRIWDAFQSGGISNPLEVIEQLTYLLLFKLLDEICTTLLYEPPFIDVHFGGPEGVFPDEQADELVAIVVGVNRSVGMQLVETE